MPIHHTHFFLFLVKPRTLAAAYRPSFQPLIRGDFWALTVLNPRVPKSNRFHGAIVRLFFCKFKVYSIDSFDLMGSYREVFELEPVISQPQPVHL